MNEKHIKVKKTARYFVLGEPSENISQVWFVCHGYGQLASYFLKNFELLTDNKTLVIAPEGMHRFYRNGFDGKVVASWMTKEDRLADIEDYVNFLDQLYIEIFESFQSHKPSVTFLGFSQGVSTVCRWVRFGKKKPDHLILWAGIFPPDLPPFEPGEKNFFDKISTRVVIGNQDEYLNENSMSDFKKIMEKQGIKFQLLTFEGKHEINAEILKRISLELANPCK